MVTAFRWDTFTHDFWGEGTISLSAILGQVKNTMLVTLWVFIGVEGAVVLSGRAKNSRDVGKATVLGLILVMSIYILISVLSMGAMTKRRTFCVRNSVHGTCIRARCWSMGCSCD